MAAANPFRAQAVRLCNGMFEIKPHRTSADKDEVAKDGVVWIMRP